MTQTKIVTFDAGLRSLTGLRPRRFVERRKSDLEVAAALT